MPDETAPAPESTLDEAARWERLCHLLVEDPEVLDGVRAALADGSGPAELVAGEAWAALIDGLDESGALAYLDVADTGDLLVDALAPLPRVVRSGVDLREVCDVDELAEAVALARGLLAPSGLTLLAIDEGDDDEECLPLVAVAEGDADEIAALVTSLGQRLLPLG